MAKTYPTVCKACNDLIDRPRVTTKTPSNKRVEYTHCHECSAEILEGTVGPKVRTTNRGTGGGDRVIRKADPFS